MSRLRITFSTASAALLVTVMVASGMAAAHDASTHGRHADGGRFSAQAAGFPPQPIGLVQPRFLSSPAVRSADSGQAVEVALATAREDARVVAMLGDRVEEIGGYTRDRKQDHPGAQQVTFYAHDTGRSVVAVVSDAQVVSVEAVPAGEWQPPLTEGEVQESVALARRFWLDTGQDRAADLQGFAIHALEGDGTPFDVRMAYVTLHADVDSRPELLAWVDLTNRTVVRSRVEAPPQQAALQPADDHVAPLPARATEVRGSAAVPYRGEVEWNGWAFSYDVSGRVDGVSLSDVSYEGVQILSRASMPAMTVFYDHPEGTPPGDTCGPFVDRLGLTGGLTPVTWADDAELVLREFQQDGQDWLEIGILDTLGNYVLYQTWYLGADGQLDAHTFAKGIQCEFDHLHYPFWRFDFAVAGDEHDEITRQGSDGQAQVELTEFDADADDAAGHDWQVRDRVTGDRVMVGFDDGSWNVPGEVVAETAYTDNRVYGRLFQQLAEENDGCRPRCPTAGEWRSPASTELGGNGGAPIGDADVVMWYRGYLPHTAVEGPDLWHSTGVRLTLDLVPRYYGRPAPR